jgi:acetyl-CoA acetyltransferase
MMVKNKETGETSMKEVTLTKDEGNRPETTLEGLASLQPVMGPKPSSPPATPRSCPTAPRPAC